MKEELSIDMLPQPTEVTCGPTCLHAVYRYYGEDVDLFDIIREIQSLEGGGTLAVILACHALKRGYPAKIFTYNLQVFDPTWFEPKPLPPEELSEKLQQQAESKNNKKLWFATRAYQEFLQLGGEIRFQDLTRQLIRKYLTRKIPILTGLSSTFLYHHMRELAGEGQLSDDIKGEPEGHFVVLSGYDVLTKEIYVADPFQKNPYSANLKYAVSIDRAICAILLGILTYDANFLIIGPKKGAMADED